LENAREAVWTLTAQSYFRNLGSDLLYTVFPRLRLAPREASQVVEL